jgi:peroxiredoxin
MRRPSTRQALGLAALFLVFFSGCPQADNGPPAGPGGTETQPGSEQSAAGQPAKQAEPEPPPPTVPEVHMPEALRDTCLVFVGDEMPGGELADLEGNTKSLAELRGEKLTVILFWNRGEELFAQMAATAALEDLQKDVAEPYGSKGVAVVAINVKDSAEGARQNVDEAGAKYPILSDPEGEYFAKVATQDLPRVYLLDADGKLLWLDVEFSRTTRRNLMQAVQVELGEI